MSSVVKRGLSEGVTVPFDTGTESPAPSACPIPAGTNGDVTAVGCDGREKICEIAYPPPAPITIKTTIRIFFGDIINDNSVVLKI
jgi:hypothetical protein